LSGIPKNEKPRSNAGLFFFQFSVVILSAFLLAREDLCIRDFDNGSASIAHHQGTEAALSKFRFSLRLCVSVVSAFHSAKGGRCCKLSPMRYRLWILLLLSLSVAAQTPDTSTHTLRDSELPKSDQLAIQHVIHGKSAKDRPSEDAVLSTRIQSIDLNDDETPEVFAQSADNCGASGNCSFWILQKSKTGYKVLLKSTAQNFRVRQVKTGGFLDVELGLHDSAYRTEWRGYKYDGSHYIRVKCWVNVTGDSEHEYPKPKVEPCSKPRP
jgi:hypothetical protein